MSAKDIKHYDLIDISSHEETLAEIKYILSLVSQSLDLSIIEEAFSNIVLLFAGKYPGFQASNTKYHNLEHTCAVTLATARLFHGLNVQGHKFPSELLELGLIGALFHDTGLVQTVNETEGTGAQYTIGHEDRSISLVRNYLEARSFSAGDIRDCSHIIQCTRLSLPLAEIPFESEDVRVAGKVLGSADLIAQMADRNYLEKLPLLFLEFKEAGMEGFETPLELFRNTEEFYHTVVRSRLADDLGSVSSAALYHFRNRWGIDRDLYAESIKRNIKYMKKATVDCADNYNCLTKKVRRNR